MLPEDGPYARRMLMVKHGAVPRFTINHSFVAPRG
jgi:hypothetical protein